MSKLKIVRVLTPALVLLAATLPRTAHAYIDPTAGSILLQVVLGGIAGLAVAGRHFLARLMRTIRRSEPPASSVEETVDHRR